SSVSSSASSSSSTDSEDSDVSTCPSTPPPCIPHKRGRDASESSDKDMFCNLKQVIQVCLLLDQEEAAEDGDETEEEQIRTARKKILADCDEITRARYKQTFEYVTEHAPYLGTLIGQRKKREELMPLIGEMQNMINHMCSEDASRLKSRMGSYAAPNPDKDIVHPPITDNSKSRAQMGFNHVQLGKMLCPAKYLADYIKDP
ncbi:hypothetical protein EV424DRAFT_1289381, partial [Suillus variegatus]